MKPRRISVFGDSELVEQFADDPETLAVLDAIAATQRSDVLERRRHGWGGAGALLQSRRRSAQTPSPRRRRVGALVLGAVVLLAVVAAASAVGLFKDYVDFGNAPSARGRLVQEFSQLPRVVGIHGPGALTGPAREVYALPGHGRVRVYAAPAAEGFCWGVTTLGGTCVTSHSPEIEPLYSGIPAPGHHEPSIIAGAVRGEPERISLTFQDGVEIDLQLTYVSNPIKASFFVYDVPATNWREGFRPKVITIYGKNGVEGRGYLMYEHPG